MRRSPKPRTPQRQSPANRKKEGQAAPIALAPATRTTLPRADWHTFVSSPEPDKRALFALTYLPLFAYFAFVGGAAFLAFRAIFRREFTLDHPAMLALVLLGSSLTTFPQFFFFRPDRPHLSEFMPGYIVAAACAAVLLSPRKPRAVSWITGAFLAAQLTLFGWYALDHYSAGTIAARTTIKPAKRKFFEGANGVRVVVSAKEFDLLEGVRRAIVENSRPGEWVVCYPYQPGYNLMSDRPTYERTLYMDNATAERAWSGQAINRIVEKRPAVIVLDDRAINGHESSRFSRWAEPVSNFVREHYRHVGTFETFRDLRPRPAS
jgi:hypothetical protein